MPRKNGQLPSTTGVTWLDVMQTTEEYSRLYRDFAWSFEMTENHLGAFNLLTTCWFTYDGKTMAVETSEPWRPSSGRLEAFVFRALIDNGKEIDRCVYARDKIG